MDRCLVQSIMGALLSLVNLAILAVLSSDGLLLTFARLSCRGKEMADIWVSAFEKFAVS